MKALKLLHVALLLFLAARAGADVNLLAMGDWGRDTDDQRKVAAELAQYVKSSNRGFNAMLLAGDNFYVRLTGVEDAKWRTMFEDLYDPRVLDFPFYVSLGNHDYQENRYVIEAEYAQGNPDSRWKFPARWYRVDLPREKPLVSVLMLDSNQPLLGDEIWNEELAWIKSELSKPRKSKWLIAVAHHPFFSNGDHGDNGVLRNAWQPLFEKAKLDLYLCGHDHDLQHLEVENFRESFMLVGGGGASTRPMRVDRRGPFSKSAHGFGDLNFTPDRMTARLIGDDGTVLHEFTRTHDGKVEMTQTTPSDPAIPRTVKSISRPDLTTQPTTKSSKTNDD